MLRKLRPEYHKYSSKGLFSSKPKIKHRPSDSNTSNSSVSTSSYNSINKLVNSSQTRSSKTNISNDFDITVKDMLHFYKKKK